MDDATLSLLRPVLDALLAGRYVLVLALLVIVATGFIRKFGAATSWVHTTWGGTLLALATSTASALALTAAAPGFVVTGALLWGSLMVGVSAAGGYALLKNLLIDPILRPFSLKAPPWTKPIFSVVFYIFDKPDPVVEVLNTGGVAVLAVPGEGVTVITGASTVSPEVVAPAKGVKLVKVASLLAPRPLRAQKPKWKTVKSTKRTKTTKT